MERLRFFGGLLLFLLAATAAVVGINAALMPYRTGGGMFLGWLLGLIALAVTGGVLAKAGLGSSGRFFIPFLLFALYSCLYGILGGQLPRLVSIRETPVISVKEAARPEHASSHVFRLSDGQIQRRYHWRQRVSRKMSAAGSYHVAPVTPEGWKESDPITLWAVGEGLGEFPTDAWRKAGAGGYRAISDATYRTMIEQGVVAARLVSDPRAPLIFLEDSPREALTAAARVELWGLIAAWGLSLASFVAAALIRSRRPPA